MQISLPITPVGKPRMVSSDRWKQRPAVMRYRDFCDEVRAALPGYELPVELHITFMLPMPKSWSKRQREQTLGAPHEQTPDIDNLAKAFMDAFKADDSHVAVLVAEKYWAEAGSIELLLEGAE